MSFLHLPLLLCACLLPIQLVAADWYAVFWNSALKSQINQTFESYAKLTPNDHSTNEFQCDHTTIAFEPADPAPYTPRLGTKQSAHILAYAHDEHAQAILLRYDGVNPIPTLNAFPHTTISDESSVGPYSAVYSNDLWARVNASEYVTITFSNGFPDSITLFNSSINTLIFPLPATQIGTNKYEATFVSVTVYAPGTMFPLDGIFCINTGWDHVTGVCTPPKPNSSSPVTSIY